MSELTAMAAHDAPDGRCLAEPLWYNDWRQMAVPSLALFTPQLPVSVVVPYYDRPRRLARTLAALEGQTYPRELFEVVVVDDGSPEPLAQPRNTPLDVKVVRQEDLGFGAARARNTGVRVAAHDVLVFLDADLLPEADWLAAHVRWHQVVPDAVTQGPWACVAVDEVDAEAIRRRPGTLKELFEGQETDFAETRWFEFHLHRTDDLTSKADDLFRIVASGNLGVRREFYELGGRFDESFTQWGGEDTEFGYRACTRGGLLVPVRDAFAWHQGLREEGLAEQDRSRETQRTKLAHLIARPDFRTGATERTFTVPQYVVTIEGGDLPAKRLLQTVERVLSGPVRDLVVRLELSKGHPGRAWLERRLGPNPKVRVAPSRPALAEFPASPFQVALPFGKQLHTDVVRRLRAALGTAVVARAVFPDGSHASITRTWALHRAARTPWEASDFGDVVNIQPGKLQPQPPLGSARSRSALFRAARRPWKRFRVELRQVDGPVSAWRFARWFGGALLRRVLPRFRLTRPVASSAKHGAPVHPPSAEYPLGVEIIALGARSQAVFAASACVAHVSDSQHADGLVTDTVNGRHADAAAVEPAASRHFDLVVADTAGEVAGADQAMEKTETEAAAPTGIAAAPTVILAEAPPMLSVPAFDARTDNPIGWRREIGHDAVGALGPLDRLPPDCGANRVVRRDDRAALRELHHLEDVAAFHADAVTRAGELARLAAMGVVVHLADGGLADGDAADRSPTEASLADGDRKNGGVADGNPANRNLADENRSLAPYLGAELFGLMTRDVRNLDLDGREALSARMRREALRTHSLTSRARQVAEHATLPDPPRPPLVSILLATRRPEMLERALAAVRRQAWPRLELILGLHGEGFGEVAPDAAGPSVPVTALRLDAALPLGAVLSALTEASHGTLLAKMDDDDLYGPNHILDLVLAHEYSQAPLVGKAAEFIYLTASDRTIRLLFRGTECYESVQNISGAALLIERRMLDRIGGWKRMPQAEDEMLVHDVVRTGVRLFRTHPYDLLVIRHGRGHTWTATDAWFLTRAKIEKAGFRPEMADIGDTQLPYSISRKRNVEDSTAPKPAGGARENACA